MEWLFDNFPIAIVLFVLYSIAAAVKRAREAKEKHEDAGDETEEQRRVREIQERIRRIAAERQGGRVPADRTQVRRIETLPPRHELPPAHETQGGPLRRMIEEFERNMQPPAPEPPPLVVHASRAEVERQEELAEQLRLAEEAKRLAERRAAHLRDARRASENPLALRRAAARGRLVEDLRDPEGLRRAFVLREVLGPPVGMR